MHSEKWPEGKQGDQRGGLGIDLAAATAGALRSRFEVWCWVGATRSGRTVIPGPQLLQQMPDGQMRSRVEAEERLRLPLSFSSGPVREGPL